ncbi:D-alanyl-D-alanine carboxypeptidase [Clostridiaceae bacterium 14S0207]|nr:D-alanyl-D-alanine carboxypeptidase [Clostridiaceae bacterium 14S0207]
MGDELIMQKIKKFFSIVVSIYVVSSILFCNMNLTFATEKNSPINSSSDGVILMDAISGDILYNKNMNKPFPPASTTKIMTALLTLENCKNLDEEATISKTCEGVDGSKIYIFEGEKIKVKNLLYALLLSSANDCAYALAEHIGGTEEHFVEMMNNRAKALGCKNTNFVNPHGLYDDKHRTTAHDLALIMKELIKHEEYLKIASTPSYIIPPTNKSKENRPLWNGNKAIHTGSVNYNKFCKASKTGYTIQSLHSYVTFAEKDGQKLIAAFVHDPNKQFYTDSKALFNYGFNTFKTDKVISKDQELFTYKVSNNKVLHFKSDSDLYITSKKNSKNNIQLPNVNFDSLNLKDKSLKQGDFIENINIKSNNNTYTLKLISGDNYEPEHNILTDVTQNYTSTSTILKTLCYTLIGLLLIFTMIIIIKKKSKKR